MPCTLYCYFKVESEAEDTLARLKALQGELAAAGWTGQLSRRCDDERTWMETYSGIADRNAFLAIWRGARERHGLGMAAHVEWFQPL
ncbi:DUF4936 family protein [Chromobacterium sp. IIBBL 290-4]|uniref:DUF4936 family protein n=1 Tax=Chromobacterium sp. IIBBL 290-4 TaxID=2953890 RepID=UPI0020B8178D|nr:DUF4936 family protein [Chromobacterium sp. IIBBL 290-4]UTH72697.1 DUF4936 family protein [Chromobacterium sp. IIBBL 290-4]